MLAFLILPCMPNLRTQAAFGLTPPYWDFRYHLSFSVVCSLALSMMFFQTTEKLARPLFLQGFQSVEEAFPLIFLLMCT